MGLTVEEFLGRREVGPSQSVGCQDARHREVILRGLHERAAEGKRGHIHRSTPNPKARPRPAAQTPSGCANMRAQVNRCTLRV